MKKNIILHLFWVLCNFVYADKLVINDSDLSTCIALESNMFEFVKGKIYSMRIDESKPSAEAILARMAQFNCHHEGDLDDHFEMARLVTLLCENRIDIQHEWFSVIFETIEFIIDYMPFVLISEDFVRDVIGQNFNSIIWSKLEKSVKLVMDKACNNYLQKSDMIKFVKE